MAGGSNIAPAAAPPALAGVNLQNSAYGLGIAMPYGRCRLTGQVLGYWDFAAYPQYSQQQSGGKGGGGGGGQSVTGYTYYAAFQMALGFGPLSNIVTTYRGKQVFNGVTAAGLSFYNGNNPQSPWPYLTTNHPGQDLNYNGLAYVAGSNYLLDSNAGLGNHSFETDCKLQYGAIPSLAKTCTANAGTSTFTSTAHGFANGRGLKFSGSVPAGIDTSFVYWVTNATANTFQLSLIAYDPDSSIVGFTTNGGSMTATPFVVDAAISPVLTDFLTDTVKGATFPGAAIGSTAQLDAYTIASGVFVSPTYDTQLRTADMLSRLMAIANAACFFSEGLLKFVPYGDQTITGNGVTFTPNTTPVYDLTDDDFLSTGGEPVVCKRTSTNDAYNILSGTFRNRSNQYNSEPVQYRDEVSIDAIGERQASDIAMDEVCDLGVARQVVQAAGQRLLYIRNRYEFKLPLKFLLLEPMDLVTLTDSGLGLNKALVRITSIEENEDETFSIMAEEVPDAVSSPALYAPAVGIPYNANYNADPGNVNTPVIFEGPGLYALSGFEVWAALSGGPDWGGAQVWASTDNIDYKLVGQVNGPSRYGVLTASLAIGSDPDTVNTLSVDLTASKGSLVSASQADADSRNTLCYVDGELISYSSVTLTAAYKYNLTTYLRRNVINTPQAVHAIGASFVRIDDALAQIPYDPVLRGQTLYLKFASFNKFNRALQSIASLTPYTHVITGGLGSPNYVTNFSATQTGQLCLFQWDLLTDVNIDGYEIRYVPGNATTLTWNDATLLTQVTKGTQITTAKLPPGYWKCFIKARDTSQNYTTTPNTALVTIISTNTVVSSKAQSPDWSGTKVNCEGHYLGNLYPTSQVLASAGSAYEVFDNYVYMPNVLCSYEMPELDIGFDDTLRVYANLASNLGPGETIGNASVTLYEDEHTSGGSYHGYLPFTIGQLTFRYLKMRINFDTSKGVPVITTFTPVVDNVPYNQQGTGVVVPSGGLTINYAPQYHARPSLQVTASGGSALAPVPSGESALGFTVKVYNSSGTDVGGTINWIANGV